MKDSRDGFSGGIDINEKEIGEVEEDQTENTQNEPR